MSPRAIPAVALALAMATSTSACAIIGTDDEPRAVEQEDIPDDLFEVSTTSTTIAEESEYELPLFFVNDTGQLVMIPRPVETEPTVQEALDALANQPSEEELAANPTVSSKLFPDLLPTAGEVVEGMLPVVVAGTRMREQTDETANRVRHIYSQIVCTINALDQGITHVQIIDDEGPVRVGLPSGEVVEHPVAPANFNECKTAADVAAEAAEAEPEGATTTTGGGSGGSSGSVNLNGSGNS